MFVEFGFGLGREGSRMVLLEIRVVNDLIICFLKHYELFISVNVIVKDAQHVIQSGVLFGVLV